MAKTIAELEQEIEGYRKAIAKVMFVKVKEVKEPGQELIEQLEFWKWEFGEEKFSEGQQSMEWS